MIVVTTEEVTGQRIVEMKGQVDARRHAVDRMVQNIVRQTATSQTLVRHVPRHSRGATPPSEIVAYRTAAVIEPARS